MMRPGMLVVLAAALMLPAAAPCAHAQGGGNAAVYVVSYLEAMPSAAGQIAGLIKDLANTSRKDPGVVRFDVLQRTSGTSEYAIFAVWRDEQALNAHTAAVHAKQFRDKAQPLLISPIDDRLCVALTAGADPAPSGSPAPVAGSPYIMTHVDIGGPNPKNMDAFLPVLKAFGEASRKSAGNVRYDVLQQKSRNNHFQVFEIWKDEKSVEDHQVSAQYRDYRIKFAPVAGALFDRRVYKSL